MKKERSIIAGTLVSMFIFTGCGGKQSINDNQPPANQPTQEAQAPTPMKQDQPTSAGEETFVGSIQDLIAKGTSMECTWNTTEDNVTMTGTMKVIGKKFRSQVTITDSQDAQGTMDVHSISDGEWMYVWNTMIPQQGTKMKLSELEAMAPKDGTPDATDVKQQALDLQKKMNYKCKSWTVSESDFALPKDVTFQDMTQMIKQMQQGLPGAGTTAPTGENTACAMCQKIPDPTAKTNCLKSAGCQ